MVTSTKVRTVASLTIFLLLIAVNFVLAKHQGRKGVELPRGNWSFSAHPYMGKDLDDRPVIVSSVETHADKGIRLTRAAVKNRSTKPVLSVKLQWSLSYEQSQDTALRNGTSDWIELPKNIPSGESRVLRFLAPPVSFVSVTNDFVSNGILTGDFYLTVLVSEVRYEDGSTWMASRIGNGRVIQVSLRNALSQVGCARQKCKNIGGGYACEASTNSEYCTNRQVSCSDTLCGEKAPGAGDDDFLIEW
jgi:hypothetical protein